MFQPQDDTVQAAFYQKQAGGRKGDVLRAPREKQPERVRRDGGLSAGSSQGSGRHTGLPVMFRKASKQREVAAGLNEWGKGGKWT